MTAPDIPEDDEKIFEELRQQYQEAKRRRAERGIVGMSPLRAAVFRELASLRSAIGFREDEPHDP